MWRGEGTQVADLSFPAARHCHWGLSGSRALFLHGKMLMSWLSLLQALLFLLPFPPIPKMENLEN